MARSPLMSSVCKLGCSCCIEGLYLIRIGGWYGWLGTALGVAACVA